MTNNKTVLDLEWQMEYIHGYEIPRHGDDKRGCLPSFFFAVRRM